MTAQHVERVSCGLLVSAGQVLLVHRSATRVHFANVWDLPGGHCEPGEDRRKALARELFEELHITDPVLSEQPVLSLTRGNLSLQIWLVHSWLGDPVNAAPEEHDDIAWFDLDTATSLPITDFAYRAIKDRLRAYSGER